ncbi:hypothetical protein GGI24_004943 [Coemansia furcata]|nr:hypothetical protein GGI24_004943 [Coemansia furcata]
MDKSKLTGEDDVTGVPALDLVQKLEAVVQQRYAELSEKDRTPAEFHRIATDEIRMMARPENVSSEERTLAEKNRTLIEWERIFTEQEQICTKQERALTEQKQSLAEQKRIRTEQKRMIIERANNANNPARLLEIHTQIRARLDQYWKTVGHGAAANIPTQDVSNPSTDTPATIPTVVPYTNDQATTSGALVAALAPTANSAATPAAEQPPIATANLSTAGEETSSSLPIAPSTDLQKAKTSFSAIRSRRRYRYPGTEHPKSKKQG